MACDAGPANVCRTCDSLLQVFDHVPAEGVRGSSVVKAAERSARWIKLGCTLEQSDRWLSTCLFAGSWRHLRRVLGVLTRPIIGRLTDQRNAIFDVRVNAETSPREVDIPFFDPVYFTISSCRAVTYHFWLPMCFGVMRTLFVWSPDKKLLRQE